MKDSQFTTEAYAAEHRVSAWQQRLADLRLDSDANEPGRLYGAVQAAVASQGMVFARIVSSPQTIACRHRESARDLFLVHMMDGQAIMTPQPLVTVSSGETAHGLVGGGISLRMEGDSRLLFVRVPHLTLAARLIRPPWLHPRRVLEPHGTAILLTGMLSAAAGALEVLERQSLDSLEMAVMEMLITLLAKAEQNAPRAASAAREATFYRVCRAIEARLGETSLRLTDIADSEGLSVRYLQKVFDAAGQTFGTYLRNRRLERCRIDLADTRQRKVTIAEIAFRWGFGDAAHFSNAFRDRFGLSPGSVRRRSAEADTVIMSAHRGRPSIASPKSRVRAASLASGAAVAGGDRLAGAVFETQPRGARHHHLPANARTVHWGYFSRKLPPVLQVSSGDVVTIETLTQHAYDDYERMVAGDPGAEDVFFWTEKRKAVERRGAGPMDASIFGRGAGEGFGVHICTGPVAVEGAQPGDVLEIRIQGISPRFSRNSVYGGRSFGSNAASWWGFQYADLLTEPKPREVVTIYELCRCHGQDCAHAVYNFRWTPQTDPFGVLHPTIDYPGVPIDRSSIVEQHGILKGVHVPVRPHFGLIGLAPNHPDYVDSVPPAAFGGNVDNWRLGAGSSLYLPVAVPGALLSVGDPHASQGDGELCGTAIECSLTGTFQLVLHRKQELTPLLADLNYPLIETDDEWIVQGFSQPNYLRELGESAQSEVYKRSSLDSAMRDAFRKVRRFLMSTRGLTEDEAISLISVGVDFGVTQVVDGNWGIHAIVAKRLFDGP